MLRKKTLTKTPKTMKPTLVLTTPESSTKSSSGSTSFLASDTKDSCYFPGCKKDANCKCEMCIESMNATLDLKTPISSLTRLSAISKPNPPSRNLIYVNQSSPLTPKFDVSPERLNLFQDKGEKNKKKEVGYGYGYGLLLFRKVLLCLGVVLMLEYGVSWMVSWGFQTKLNVDVVRIMGQNSRGLEDLNQRLDFFKNEMQGWVNASITDCTSVDSNWKINQDGLLLNSKCVLYKSMSEEVSIWGWPLQTAGLLTADFSSRSFTILSGRVTEWKNGGIGYMIHKTNSSWRKQKWDSSAVQLDAKTWILEYKHSYITENARLVSAALEFMKFRATREFGKMKKEFWQGFDFGSHSTDLGLVNSRTPT